MSDNLKMLKLGDVSPGRSTSERTSPWQITRNESFSQKPTRTSEKPAASACRTKGPIQPPLPACVLQPTIANTPNRALSASVPNHSPAKVRSANTKLPAERNVWKCSSADFAGIKLA